jgi:hypothetical protein
MSLQASPLHELTLFFYPSPGLDWSSPASLTRTTMIGNLLRKRRSLGHVSVRVQSDGIDIFTGMTQQNKSEGRNEVLWKGFGLGILLHNFKGRLETKEELEPELELRMQTGLLSFIKFKLSPAHCTRLDAFLKAYQDKKGHETYGMIPRPLYGEGGGCSAFGAAFLQIAGLMEEEFEKSWTRSFLIPKKFTGGPSTNQYISPLQMFLAQSWATPDEPHEKGFFWDPDLMHQWVLSQWEKESSQPTGRYVLHRLGNARGLVLDRTQAANPSSDLILSDTSRKTSV